MSLYDDITSSIKKTSLSLDSQWKIAESLREISRYQDALKIYEALVAAQGERIFLAHFWAAYSAEKSSVINADSPKLRKKLITLRDRHDKATWKYWLSLPEKNRRELFLSNKSMILEIVNEANRLKSPTRMLLNYWVETFKEKSTPPAGDPVVSIENSLKLIDKLESLGLMAEAKIATSLLVKMGSDKIGGDQSFLNEWSRRILKLAETMRGEGRHLEAGKLFATVADKRPNWEKRAKYFFQAGLLFYRSGRRQEAIKYLRSASEDANDLHYANLAKQRLSQLKE